MSYSGAMARARALKAELEKRGVKVSIEIQQGRPGTPNDAWYDTRFIGTMGHHIVSTRSQGLTPGLALIKRGRSDVPGPLCNAYLGFDGWARIICMGWANHPGAGGPLTLPGGTIPRDVARPYLFGWEIEGGVHESDWTPEFRVLMGKCHAATLAWLKRDERSHAEHKTWTLRKIDRLGYSLSEARAELKPHLDATHLPPELEDDMPYKDWPEADRKALAKDVADAVLDARVPRFNGKNKVRVGTILGWIYRDSHQLNSGLVSRILNMRIRRHNGGPVRLETILGWTYRDGRDDPALVVENPDGGMNSKPVALAEIWRLLSGKKSASRSLSAASVSAPVEDDESDDVTDERDEDAEYAEDDER